MSQPLGAGEGAGTGVAPVAAPAGEDASRAAELRRLLETRRGERHLVAIQDFPDPDAISAGLAYRAIARAFDVEVDVGYDGLISHPENLALVNLLEIRLRRWEDGIPLDQYNAAVFVDNQGSTTHLTERLKAAGIPTLAVIDHHDPQDVLDPIFSDVRPVAAAATILAEYLQSEVFLKMDPDNAEHVRLATALMHGIHSETDGFVRARPPEYRAAAFLSRYMDPDLLERVLCVQKSRGTMQVIEAALRNRDLRGGFSVAGVGFLRWADRDAVPQAADFLLTEENVHTVVVFGLLCGDDGREVVTGSLRTTKATLGVDAFLKEALGKDPSGRPYGGGRSRAGGFEIDLGFLQGDEDDDSAERSMKWAIFDRKIRRKIFDEAGLGDADDEGVGADCG